jgi:hypothetical protein
VRQPGSEAAYNHIRGHHDCSKTTALYHDDGSAYWTDHHNVIQLLVGPTPCAASFWANMWTPYIHDCHLMHNFADNNVSGNAGTDCSITDTTIMKDGAVPAEAQAIIAAAGPRGLR